MNKEELELYDMVLNSKKSFDVNYKELAISLRAELKKLENKLHKAYETQELLEYRIQRANEYIDDIYKNIDEVHCLSCLLFEIRNILDGDENE